MILTYPIRRLLGGVKGVPERMLQGMLVPLLGGHPKQGSVRPT